MLLVMMSAAPAIAAEGKWEYLLESPLASLWTSASGGAPGKGWLLEDSMLHRVSGSGDLISKARYTDFELEFEWKISKRGNSGVKYRVRKKGPAWIGAEYQVLDNERHPNGRTDDQRAGSLYDVVAAKKGADKPAGEWNRSKIVVKGESIVHWLNGEKVVEVDLGSEQWRKLKSDSKFSKVVDFAAAEPGRLLVQDHGDEVWFRAMRIRPL
ncbi:hypothetical protein Hsar01_02961 [Haloferula sargassicola]|uniref:3-keto-alpha-glucoside-1,2-lyase/3-keto-2-hydroxy-glucal hydratase domain-containing protein n=2 Tax=Haloferula sargassicola TaxID=490096 RepID=A0ABP9USQ9_9BACT